MNFHVKRWKNNWSINLRSKNWKSEWNFHHYRACYGVVRFIMESGAKGCEVVVSGKLRGQRAKSMKFTDGFMIHSGYPIQEYIDMAVRHVYLRQGEYLVSLNCKFELFWRIQDHKFIVHVNITQYPQSSAHTVDKITDFVLLTCCVTHSWSA